MWGVNPTGLGAWKNPRSNPGEQLWAGPAGTPRAQPEPQGGCWALTAKPARDGRLWAKEEQG